MRTDEQQCLLMKSEDCVDSRSDIENLRTRDCLYGKSKQTSKIRRLLQFGSFVAEDSNFVVNSVVHR